jgi:hypothetical protein
VNNSAFALDDERASHILTRMRKAIDDADWEEIVRTMLERLGPQAFAELIDYVLDEQCDNADLMRMAEPPPPMRAST